MAAAVTVITPIIRRARAPAIYCWAVWDTGRHPTRCNVWVPMLLTRPTHDLRLGELLALDVRLTQSLLEAGVLRIRLQRTRDVNRWPDFVSSVHPASVNVSKN